MRLGVRGDLGAVSLFPRPRPPVSVGGPREQENQAAEFPAGYAGLRAGAAALTVARRQS
jgi:hypothetical protein